MTPATGSTSIDASITSAIASFSNHCQHEKKFSTHTIKAYTLDLSKFSSFIASTSPSMSLEQIDKEHVRGFIRAQEGQKPRSIRRRIATLKSFFRYLQRERLRANTPLDHLDLKISLGKPIPKVVSLEAIGRILASAHSACASNLASSHRHADAVRDTAVLELLFASGIRVAELCQLTCDAIDLREQSVRVMGKGARERIIPLSGAELLRALQAYITIRNTQSSTTAALFLNRHKRRLSEPSVRRIVGKYAKAASVERVTPHTFRHSVATLLLERGTDIRYIQLFLGHSSITTTTIYTHVAQATQRRILEANHPRHAISVAPKTDN